MSITEKATVEDPGMTLSAPIKQDMRDAIVDSWIEAADHGVNIAVVVADSTSTSKIAPFEKKHPHRVVNVGIAEQTMVGVATGLSMGGYVAFTANAAPFLVGRANEQVKNDICYSESNVKMIGLNAGICYSNLGSTHHAIDDLSIMRGFGPVQIFAPADSIEAREMMRYAIAHVGPLYLRMDSAALPVYHGDNYRFVPGAVDCLKEGADCTLCAIGSVVHEAMDAALALAQQGIEAQVLNISSLRPLDRSELSQRLVGHGPVVSVEEHSVAGGLGSLIAELIAEEGLGCRLKRLGIAEGAFAKCGPRAQVRAYSGIDTQGVVRAALALMGR